MGSAVFVEAVAADRLADAAQNLMEAARAATTGSPHYKQGKLHTAESVALAVQAVFMADIWDQAGKEVPLDPELTIVRCRGLGMGVGCAIAAVPNMATQNRMAMAVLEGMSRAGMQRQAVRRETGK